MEQVLNSRRARRLPELSKIVDLSNRSLQKKKKTPKVYDNPGLLSIKLLSKSSPEEELELEAEADIE